MCKKSFFDTQIFKNSPYHGPTPFPRLGRFTPSLWPRSSVIILFMFALYISRYPSVRNTHFPWIWISSDFFFIENFPKNPPKVCTRSFNFNLKYAKAPSCGRGDTPSHTLPPARALRALACSFPSIVDNLAPLEKNPAYGLGYILCRYFIQLCRYKWHACRLIYM